MKNNENTPKNAHNAYKKNDILRVTVESISGNGCGIAKHDGFVIFIPNAAEGDELEIKLIKLTKTYAVARIEKLISPSPDRISDECECGKSCGGCDFRHISYEKECEYKRQSIDDCFERIAKSKLRVEEFYPSDAINNYRNKAIYPIKTDRDGRLIAGFYAKNSHRVVPHEKCLIGAEIFSPIKNECLRFFNEKKLTAYDEESLSGLLRAIYLRISSAGEVLLTLILNGKSLRDEETEREFCERIKNLFPNVVGILINVNEKNTNALLSHEFITLCGEPYLYETILGKRFRISPDAFLQVNHASCEKLYSTVSELIGEKDGKTILDLYCGAGTIGISTAGENTRLVGAEITKAAVENARFNAELNKIKGEFYALDADRGIDKEFLASVLPDVIILDPPRSGSSEATVRATCESGTQRVVYISCDPATLARDITFFEKYGMTAKKAVAVDMFPRTGHVETVVLLQRRDM